MAIAPVSVGQHAHALQALTVLQQPQPWSSSMSRACWQPATLPMDGDEGQHLSINELHFFVSQWHSLAQTLVGPACQGSSAGGCWADFTCSETCVSSPSIPCALAQVGVAPGCPKSFYCFLQSSLYTGLWGRAQCRQNAAAQSPSARRQPQAISFSPQAVPRTLHCKRDSHGVSMSI